VYIDVIVEIKPMTPLLFQPPHALPTALVRDSPVSKNVGLSEHTRAAPVQPDLAGNRVVAQRHRGALAAEAAREKAGQVVVEKVRVRD
jgi:hypothetical protein